MENNRPATSLLISVHRHNYTVFALERIHRVTGMEFGVSGDSLLRHQRNMLKIKLNAAAREIGNRIYRDTDS